MDERLKEKLELLGEPTLPDSLTAGELFRRMDSGELVLPEEPEVEAEAAPPENVIPWAKILRRSVPIAACLALVVFISQGRFWRMGSSGGANLTNGAAAAPQAAAATDQSEGDAPMESYSFDDEAEAPEPFRSIAIEADDAKKETEQEVFDDIAEEDTADSVANAEDEPLRPDSGGDDLRPDTGGDPRPDIWVGKIGEDDPDNEKPDIPVSLLIQPLLEELCGQLYLQDEALTGLTPFLAGYGPAYAMDPDSPDPLHGRCLYLNDEGKAVTCRVLYCSVNQDADGNYSLTLLSFEDWDGQPYFDWINEG